MGKSNETIFVSLDKIRFTHSRIRPVFTGCCKRIEDTLAEIKCGTTKLETIPLITVIENDDEYYSLNNRRLFLLKCLNNDGFIADGKVRVVKKQPLSREISKYTKANCSLTAVLMKEFSEEKRDGSIPESLLPRTVLKVVEMESSRKSTMFHAEVKRSIKELRKLVLKGKLKEVHSQLDEWIMNGLISEGEEYENLKIEIALQT